MALLLAVDPGPAVSGWVLFDLDARAVLESGSADPTAHVVSMCEAGASPGGREFDLVACEMIASYGMAVGKEVFETCLQIGRICHAREMQASSVQLVTRMQVKSNLCHSAKAKDANVRQALIDRFGEVGTKKTPGPLFGVSVHAWAALGVAAYYLDVVHK